MVQRSPFFLSALSLGLRRLRPRLRLSLPCGGFCPLPLGLSPGKGELRLGALSRHKGVLPSAARERLELVRRAHVLLRAEARHSPARLLGVHRGPGEVGGDNLCAPERRRLDGFEVLLARDVQDPALLLRRLVKLLAQVRAREVAPVRVKRRSARGFQTFCAKLEPERFDCVQRTQAPVEPAKYLEPRLEVGHLIPGERGHVERFVRRAVEGVPALTRRDSVKCLKPLMIELCNVVAHAHELFEVADTQLLELLHELAALGDEGRLRRVRDAFQLAFVERFRG
mmetsp:Transcript_28339/g.92551  ORF Transcript_28339/g.92551 Transcript_28339/m.92551 type:complete len:283 (+) Transcript_28339:45-893(+)